MYDVIGLGEVLIDFIPVRELDTTEVTFNVMLGVRQRMCLWHLPNWGLQQLL